MTRLQRQVVDCRFRSMKATVEGGKSCLVRMPPIAVGVGVPGVLTRAHFFLWACPEGISKDFAKWNFGKNFIISSRFRPDSAQFVFLF